MVEFYLLTFSRFPLRKKKRTQIQILVFTRIELTTSALVGVRGYLLDHAGTVLINILGLELELLLELDASGPRREGAESDGRERAT